MPTWEGIKEDKEETAAKQGRVRGQHRKREVESELLFLRACQGSHIYLLSLLTVLLDEEREDK